jgi:hypothetical protein
MAPKSEVFAVEGVLILGFRCPLVWIKYQVASGLMQGHSGLEFDVLRVFIAQQNVPCFLLKAENLVCCAARCRLYQKFIAARCRLYQNNHWKALAPFRGFVRCAVPSLLQICLSRGRWIFVSQFLIKRRPRMQFSVGLFLDRE